ncbi:hypothetical protein Cni_G01214 [Canna indica]|uniref:Uncharacterized protein n=1 Tax=Canna indica TaxID=4628 RepID=A0AAQ3JM94_9LILI|nr:hypothetical protein Cni_G01214 [Canna indica]
MEEKYLDLVMVPLGLLLQVIYNLWLLTTIIRDPKRTVIGLNAQVRERWVKAMMADSMQNAILAVQTVRNNIMAATVLGTTAITLVSLISIFVSATSPSSYASRILYGNKSATADSIKFFSVSLCFILAFLCNVQCIRYCTHVSFLITQPAMGDGSAISPDYVTRSLNRGSYFWSLGLRAFYVSFTLFLWIFGPIPMLVSSVVMCCLLFFLDTTTEFTRGFHLVYAVEEDVEQEV